MSMKNPPHQLRKGRKNGIISLNIWQKDGQKWRKGGHDEGIGDGRGRNAGARRDACTAREACECARRGCGGFRRDGRRGSARMGDGGAAGCHHPLGGVY